MSKENKKDKEKKLNEDFDKISREAQIDIFKSTKNVERRIRDMEKSHDRFLENIEDNLNEKFELFSYKMKAVESSLKNKDDKSDKKDLKDI